MKLLPYHKMAEHKYEALNMHAESYASPSDEKMKIYKELFGNQQL